MKKLRSLIGIELLSKGEQKKISGGLGSVGLIGPGGGGECDNECESNSDCPAEHPKCVTFNLSTSCPNSPMVKSCI